MMTLAEIRLKQNPILTSLLLGMGQGNYIAERMAPRLPQTLSGVTLAKIGDERFRRYNLRRAPGAATRRVNINFDGQVYTVNQYAVEVPIPRELIREADESRRLNVGNYLDISRVAMVTANDILGLDYELEVAEAATNPANYVAGNVLALAAGTKWSADTGTPVTDIEAASNLIRKAVGKRPNRLGLSADAFSAIKHNPEVKGYLPSSQQGPATLQQLAQILNVEEVLVGDAIWKDETGAGQDVWGNNAVLSYVPRIAPNTGDISLAEPGHMFTSVIEGHPFSETPYYEAPLKSWVYGATFERHASVAYPDAAFLFQNPY